MTLPLREMQTARPSEATSTARITPVRIERRINYSLLTVSMLLVAFGLPAAHYWHKYQLRRQTSAQLEIAREAEEAGDWRLAEAWLRNYLLFVPDDLEAQIRLAEAIDKGARFPQERLVAVRIYSELIDAHPERVDLKVKLATLQLGSNPEAALKTIDSVVERLREDTPAEALQVRAMVLDVIRSDEEGVRELQSVIDAYSRAFEKDPKNMPTGFRLATLYRENATRLSVEEAVNRQNLENRADSLVDEVVFNNREDPEAYLNRYRYRLLFPKRREKADSEKTEEPKPDAEKNGSTAAAAPRLDEDIERALQLDPEHGAARLLAASNLVNAALNDPLVDPETATRKVDPARLAEAEGHLRKALEKIPGDPGCYLVMAQIHTLRGDQDKAIRTLEDGIKAAGPDDPIMNSRLAGMLTDAGRWEEAAAIFKRLDEIIPILRARLRRPSDADRIVAATRLMEASWYAGVGNPKRNLVRAANLLQEANRATTSTELSASANYRLGQIHAALSQWDLAITAYLAASGSSPGAVLPVLGIADALRRSGQFQHAIVEYQRVLGMVERTGAKVDVHGIWLDLARAHLGMQSQLPEEKRDWTSFEDAIAAAKKIDPNSFMPLSVEVLAVIERNKENKQQAVSEMLEAQKEKFHTVPGYWQTAAETYLSVGSLAKAEECIAEFERLMKGKAVNLRAKAAMARGQGERARRILAEAGQAVGGPELLRLLAYRADIAAKAGNYIDAIAIYQELHRMEPNNVAWPWELTQIAVKTRDLDQIRAWESTLRSIEGNEGTFWRFAEVQRLLLDAEYGTRGSLGPAADICRQLISRRPGWPPALIVQGLVAEAQGRLGEASDSYRRAFELGDRDPALSRKFVGLLLMTSADPLALGHLDQLPPEVLLHPELAFLTIHVMLRQGQVDRAIALGRLGIELHPQIGDYHTLLAKALLAKDDPTSRAEAEAHLRKAVEVTPADPSAWLALLHFYVNTNHPDGSYESLVALRQASEVIQGSSESLANSRKAYVVAKTYELTGDLKVADRFYRKAFLENPRDPLLRRLPRSTYYSAELGDPSVSLWAGQLRTAADPVRKMLGLMLAASNADVDQKMGIDLLREETRLRAVAWAALGGPDHRRQAVEFLERVPAADRTRGDLFLLGRLHESLSADDRAYDYYRQVLDKGANIRQLSVIADFCLHRQRFKDAEVAIAGMEKIQPEGLMIPPLKIRLQAGKGDRAGAVAIATRYVGEAAAASASEEPQRSIDAKRAARQRLHRAVNAADWLLDTPYADEGTKLLRSVVGDDQTFLPELVIWLAGRPGSEKEALDLCEKFVQFDKESVESAALAAQALLRAGAQNNDHRFDVLFERHLASQEVLPTSFLTSMAILREHQGRPDEAIAITQRTLETRPRDVLSLNNMAWFLSAYKGEHKEALALIDDVMLQIGPIENVLDTKGVALLGLKQPQAAVRLFETCCDGPSPLANHYLHLAEGYHKLERPIESARALKESRRHGLANLPPRDQKVLRELGGQEALSRTP